MPFLLAVARTGSARRAARELRVAATTVTRRLLALEADLGVSLFDRHGEGWSLTDAGQRVVTLAREMELQASGIEREAHVAGREAPGEVRVSATEAVCAEVIAPSLGALYRAHPGIRVVLHSQAELVSLARGEADVAVRMVRPEGQSLVIRRLGSIDLGLYQASRADFADNAHADLSGVPVLGYDESFGPIAEVRWFADRGVEDYRLRATSTRALVTATRQGLGVALLPVFWADATGDLARIERPDLPSARDVWLTYHEELRGAPAVRALSEHLVRVFADTLDAQRVADGRGTAGGDGDESEGGA